MGGEDAVGQGDLVRVRGWVGRRGDFGVHGDEVEEGVVDIRADFVGAGGGR